MLAVALMIDSLNRFLGKSVSWLALGMVVMMSTNVAMRYLFSEGTPWQQEIVRFMHGIVFLAGAAYALQREQHVRVDILYQGFCDRKKAWVNIIGTLMFLFPVAIALIYFSLHYVLGSWAIYEGSTEYKGMPGVFIFKTFIWVAGGTLILQGVSSIIHSIRTLQGKEPAIQSHHEEHV